MRKLQAVFVFLCVSLVSCDDKNADDQSRHSAKVVEVENRAINGERWRITSYKESNVDQTAAFAGYIFEFDPNRLLTVTNGSDNISGTWSVSADNSDDDNTTSEFDDIDFNISFTNPPLFMELTEDWEIISLSNAKIELRHTSGGNGSIDLLTFEKI